ncbi:hypothetical protein DMN91_004026 [Ooceraea biroi]|uniref:DUF5641 domain-containing protein n=1 Tax=Ooceraea biroi TaxID=2015173 RepID=A0A3L8DVN3_OOCBI|nr:hypothetical protein DMN91_004026 [Ooceraea biroi]
MGNLPRGRVNAARPFLRTGIDYAGPIFVRTTKGRGHRAHKAFIAVFVCLCTKAVHLEVVSDYSAEAFLAALRRFVSRRGLCEEIYSDCGTNFVGADRELKELWKHIQKMRDHFWQRWSREYIHGLAFRPKWLRGEVSPIVGSLCLIRSEATPPSKWPLTRIVKIHPGDEGIVRVVTVRTANSELVRPTVKIVLLPIATDAPLPPGTQPNRL